MEVRNMSEYAALVAIDWADQQHAVCLSASGSGEREQTIVKHTPAALQEWALPKSFFLTCHPQLSWVSPSMSARRGRIFQRERNHRRSADQLGDPSERGSPRFICIGALVGESRGEARPSLSHAR